MSYHRPNIHTKVIHRVFPIPADGEWPEEYWVEVRLPIGMLVWKEGTTHMQMAADLTRLPEVKIRKLELMTVNTPDDVLRVWVEPMRFEEKS